MYKFSAKVNGTSFVSTDIMAMPITSEGVEWIAIGAEDASGNKIAVNVRSNLTAATYQISSNTLTDKVQATHEDATDEYQAVSGSVIITSITA